MKTHLLVLIALTLGWFACSASADDYRGGRWSGGRYDWRRHQNDWRVYNHGYRRYVWVDDHFVWQRGPRGYVAVFVPGHYERVR